MLIRIGLFAIALLLVAFVGSAQLRPARVILLLGPPGSGKTVQAKLLSKTYKIPAISMASLLQQEMGKKTPLGKALASALASGELVSNGAASEVMEARLLRPDAGGGFVLDGYPSTEEQAKALDAFLADHQFGKPIVVVLESPDNVLRERLKSRRRIDDAPGNIERRVREYRDLETLIERRYGSDFTARVDATGNVQRVASEIVEKIDGLRLQKGLVVRPAEGSQLKQR